MLYPREYTVREGGNFEYWVYGAVTYPQLKKLVGNAICNQVTINGIILHCLIFESAAAGLGNYARWDCVNGWTTTIAQARKRFPNGLHGSMDMRKLK